MSANGDKISFTKVILMDVQALFGGFHVIVHDDGEIYVHSINPRKKIKSKKYRVVIKSKKIKELDDLITKHDFKNIKIEDRQGIPDEARPNIKVNYRSGEEVEKQKWINDEHPEFDPIYDWLLNLAKAFERRGKPYESSKLAPGDL